MTDKERLRSAWSIKIIKQRNIPLWGKAAEKLRGLELYRHASTVFAAPAESLHQARINCLADGKNLIMPAPSIREGFFLLPARTVPFKDLSPAVTFKGLAKYGKLLKSDAIKELAVQLLLTDSLAVDQGGNRVGDGKGFFDLCCAILQELGGLQPGWAALTLILDEQLSFDLLPQDAWDIKMAGAVTPFRVHTFKCVPQKPQIFWNMLARDRIRRIDPLWKLSKISNSAP